jgi:hypothetical protein
MVDGGKNKILVSYSRLQAPSMDSVEHFVTETSFYLVS